jgi:4-diphosphocytidyl-2-C-methyl-D-erythritol kinase
MASASEAWRSAVATPQYDAEGFHGPWPAPAKLNLMLRILGRREDGYHELQTVFQFINRYDHLSFRVRGDGQVMRDRGPVAVPEAQDLTLRAARRLQAETGCRLGVEVRLDKHLPIGGGLGGGSSNAATTLTALNQLWRLGLNQDELAQLGLSLGADVPVFINGHAAWGEGIGERLTPVVLPEPWYLVLVPPCQVSTAAVFADAELTRHSTPITMPDFLAGNAGNDCRAVVQRRYPQVADALDWLDHHGGTGRLTGTGGCVFATMSSQADAYRLLTAVPTSFSGFVARGLNRSPLSEIAGAV